MFSIVMVGPGLNAPRLVSAEKLTPEDFEKLAKQLGMKPVTALKTGVVAARLAAERELVETRWNGKETSALAQPGDLIVTNLGADRSPLRDRDGHTNVYVIRKDKFPTLYERAKGKLDCGEIYRARATVEALYFAGGFEILTPWDEIQRADAGYIVRNGDEVYGNNKETFEATYVIGN